MNRFKKGCSFSALVLFWRGQLGGDVRSSAASVAAPPPAGRFSHVNGNASLFASLRRRPFAKVEDRYDPFPASRLRPFGQPPTSSALELQMCPLNRSFGMSQRTAEEVALPARLSWQIHDRQRCLHQLCGAPLLKRQAVKSATVRSQVGAEKGGAKRSEQ